MGKLKVDLCLNNNCHRKKLNKLPLLISVIKKAKIIILIEIIPFYKIKTAKDKSNNKKGLRTNTRNLLKPTSAI